MGDMFRGALTDTYSSLGPDTPYLGQVAEEVDSNGNRKKYIFVKNGESSSALVAKRPVYRDFSAPYQVKLIATNTANLFAGVPMAAIKAGEYGWVQIAGKYADAKVVGDASNATAVGDSLKVNGTGSSANLVLDQAKGTEPSYDQCAFALEAVSAGASEAEKDVWLKCQGIWGL